MHLSEEFMNSSSLSKRAYETDLDSRVLNDVVSERVSSEGLSLINLGTFDDSRVDVLDFSGFPTGTHKYPKAVRALKAATDLDEEDLLIAISSGNYARALKCVAEAVERRVVLVTSPNRVGQDFSYLEGEYTDLVTIADLQEAIFTAVKMGMKRSAKKDIRDLTGRDLERAYLAWRKSKGDISVPAVHNVTNLFDIERLERYQPSLGVDYNEVIDDEVRYNYVFCPNGSGELLFELMCQGSLSEAVFYGISPYGHPSLTQSTSFDERDKFVSTADKLCTPVYPIKDKHLSGKIESSTRLRFIPISEGEIGMAYDCARENGFCLEPSAAVSFSFFNSDLRKTYGIDIPSGSNILLVSTGNGAK